jgi:hypothetical protein
MPVARSGWMLMAKQPPRTPNSNAPTDRPAQPDKPRRTRAGAVPSRSEAQATAAPPQEAKGIAEIDDTFAARRTANDTRPDEASQSEKRSTSMASSPSEEDIRMRAYQRYLERGGGHGMDFEDWLEAERELKRSK